MKILLFSILVTFILQSFAKRVAPPIIKPLNKNGVTYSTSVEGVHGPKCEPNSSECGMEVFLSAESQADKKELWKTSLYRKLYDMRLETDVQDVLPKSLKFIGKDKIEVINENDARFVVSTKTGVLERPALGTAMNEPLPSNATEKIFEMLFKTDSPEAKMKAPAKIEVENVTCTIGSASNSKMVCTAKFTHNGQNKEKTISGDNDLFFRYLSGKNGIALGEMLEGGTVYKAKALSCRYNLDRQPYYRCFSELSVEF